MKHALQAFTVVLLIALFTLTACQPTPGDPSVINKGDGSLERKIASGAPDGYRFEAPESYTKEYSYYGGKMKLAFNEDTQIIVPNVDKFPVYEASIEGFSKETVQKVVDLYFGNQQMIAAGENMLTKAQIKEQISEYQQLLAELENGTYIHSETDPNPTPEIDDVKAIIESLEHSFNRAPISIPTVPVTLDSYNGSSFSADVVTEDGSRAAIRVSDSKLEIINDTRTLTAEDDLICVGEYSPKTWIKAHNDDCDFGRSDKRYTDDYDFGISCSEDEAISMAREFVEALGLDYMKYAYVSVKKPSTGGSEFDIEASNKYLYGVLFMRELSGISFGRAAGAYRASGDYDRAFYYERFIVYIGDGGIESIIWTSPLKIERTLTESVELLPFESLVERYVDDVCQHIYPEMYSDFTLKVQTLELGYSMIRRIDQPERYMIVPTWDIYAEGRHLLIEFPNDPIAYYGTGSIYSTFPAKPINAIDGSNIDRYLGY